MADVVAVMSSDSGIAAAELRVDGGAADNDFLMQFQADLLNISVVRPSNLQTTALGAAFLAGVGVGWYTSTEAIGQSHRSEKRFQPEADHGWIANARNQWRQAIKRSRDWATGINNAYDGELKQT